MYGKFTPPREPIPINVGPFVIRDDVPDEQVSRAVVKQLKNERGGGASKIRAEGFKSWLRGMIDEEENSTGGAGDQWRVFVNLIELIWEQGKIPQ